MIDSIALSSSGCSCIERPCRVLVVRGNSRRSKNHSARKVLWCSKKLIPALYGVTSSSPAAPIIMSRML